MDAADNRSRQAVSSLRIAILLGSLSFGLLLFALPIYAKGLGASTLDIGGVFSIFAVVITVARPVVGWGIDRWGRKTFLIAGLLFYALAMLLFSQAHSVGLLYVARLAQGIGSSLLWIPAYTIATELSGHGWGRSVGYIDMSSARGGFFGSFLGFGLILLVSTLAVAWSLAFVGYTVAAALAAFVIWRRVPETHNAEPSNLKKATSSGNSLDRTLLLRLMLIVFLTGASTSMISPVLMIFLQDRFTPDIPSLAATFIPAAIVYAWLPGRLGALSDRFGRAPLIALGLIGAGLVSVGMPSSTSLVFLAVLWILEAVGLAAAVPAETALVADLAGENVRGTGYGLYMFASGFGFTLGPLLGGWLYDHAGHAMPFYINAVILFLGAGLAFWFLRQKPKKRSA